MYMDSGAYTSINTYSQYVFSSIFLKTQKDKYKRDRLRRKNSKIISSDNLSNYEANEHC